MSLILAFAALLALNDAWELLMLMFVDVVVCSGSFLCGCATCMGAKEEDGSSKLECMLSNGKQKQPNLPIWAAFMMARFNEGVAR
jgi:hypothetical protein